MPTQLHEAHLPQSGFGQIQDFTELRKCQKLVFRLYTPRHAQLSATSDEDAFFLAGAFENSAQPEPTFSYSDVVRHLDWTTRHDSNFISASFSFSWALWEAYKRRHLGVKHDLEIAVIDANAISACTPTDVLAHSSPEGRHASHWKWYSAMQDSQSVLIFHSVRKRAVLASLPLRPLLDSLPAYFRPGPCDMHMPWLGSTHKHSYSSFCREMNARFLRQDDSTRLHSATTGSLRLACSFLRPWLSRPFVEQDHLISMVSSLALHIAHWPARIWSIEHPEIEGIIAETTILLVEHLQFDRKEREESFGTLEAAIEDLEHIIGACQDRLGKGNDNSSVNEQQYEIPEEIQSTPSALLDPVTLEAKQYADAGTETVFSLVNSAEQAAEVDTNHVEEPEVEVQYTSESSRSATSKSPSVVEQASFATFFFLVSAMATLAVGRSPPPFLAIT